MQLNSLTATLRYFLLISGELILLFVGISFLVGLIQEFIPDEKMRKVLGKPRKIVGNILGATFGALTPFCSCSTIPILVGLLNSGAPFGASMSFLLTSPVLNPIIIGLFWSLFGWQLTLAYSLLVFVLAVLGGWIWEKLGLVEDIKDLGLVNTSNCCCSTASSCCSTPEIQYIDLSALNKEPDFWKDTLKPKLIGAGQKAWALFRQVFPYLLIGAGIGALIYGFVPADWVTKVAGPQNAFAVPIAAVVGIPMYIRAETIIPIGITLINKGMATGTVVALIIGGAGASIPEVTLLASIFRTRLVVAFVLTVLIIATITGYVFNYIF